MRKGFKVAIFTPVAYANRVREAIGKANGGKLGNYSFCSFSARGIGRFRPEKGSRPFVGKVGKIERVKEEKIEITCVPKDLKKIIREIKKVHPYEEPAIDVFPVEIW